MAEPTFGLIGQSPAIQRIVADISRIGATRVTVNLTGESGVGKELVARALHTVRGEGEFVAINCGAITRDLIESALFGHEKGAFTGASNSMPGLLENANGVTLFLDEIGEMPMGPPQAQPAEQARANAPGFDAPAGAMFVRRTEPSRTLRGGIKSDAAMASLARACTAPNAVGEYRETNRASLLIPCLARYLLALALLTLSAAPLSGQRLQGTLLDAESRGLLASVTVELLAGDGTVKARVLSSQNGAFSLTAPEPGSYHVRAWRVAMDTLLVGPIELEAGATLTRELLLSPLPIGVEGIDVRVEGRVPYLEREGFYQRQQTTSAVFLTPEAIEKINPQRTLDLLGTLPGLQLYRGEDDGPGTTFRVVPDMVDPLRPRLMTRAGIDYERRSGTRRSCLPVIYLDGRQVQSGGSDPSGVGEFDVNTILAGNLLALEVYRSPAETPVQFSGQSSTCGVIVIWTDYGVFDQPLSETGRLPVPIRSETAFVRGWDWSEEEEPYAWGLVLGSAFLGNVLGLGIGFVAARQCLELGNRGTLLGTCHPITDLLAGSLAVGLPVGLASYGARRSGATERTQGHVFPAMLLAGGSTLTGYLLAFKARSWERPRQEQVGVVILGIGTPLLVTFSDRLLRILR